MSKSFRANFRICAIIYFFGICLNAFSQTGAIDPSFSVGEVLTGLSPGKIYALTTDSSGAVLIAGDFTSIGGTNRGMIAKLDSSGKLMSSFGSGTGANGPIRSMLVQTDGKILVGGEFTSINGTARNRIARLNSDGSLDTTFIPGSGANGTVFAIATTSYPYYNSGIIIGGDFTSFNGTNRGRVALLSTSGSLNTSYLNSSGANGTVYTIAATSNSYSYSSSSGLYFGGAFTTFDGQTRKRIAKLDSNLRLEYQFNLSSGPNGPIYCISLIQNGFSGTSLLVGGEFTEFNGYIRGNLALLSSSYSFSSASNLDQFFDVWTDGAVRTIANPSQYYSSTQNIYIGGDFQMVNGASRKRIAKIVTSSYSGYPTSGLQRNIDATFNPDPGINARVSTVAYLSDSRMLVGGEFSAIQSVTTPSIARLLGAYGANIPTAPTTISAQPASSTQVIVTFSVSSYASSYQIERSVDQSTWTQVGNSSSPYFDQGLTPSTTYYYRTRGVNYNGSGAYSSVASCATDGNVWYGPGSLDPNISTNFSINGAVNDFAVQSDGKIVIVGEFTQVNSVSKNRIARLNSDWTLDTAFATGAGANSSIYSVALQSDNKIIISGYFSSIHGISTEYIARLNADGSLDGSFNPGLGPDSYARVITLQSDGKIVIGGNFGSYNGMSQENLARINPDGSLDLAFRTTPNSSIYDIKVLENGKIIIAGDFSTVNGITKSGVALLNSDGTLDATYNTGSGSWGVRVIAIQSDGKSIIGGSFTTFSGLTRNRVARLNADGSVDTTFDPGKGPDGTVNSLSLDQNGWVVIGGDFTSVQDTYCFRIGRLNLTGTIDPTFKTGLGASGSVKKSICIGSSVIISGSFSTFGGAAKSYLLKLIGGGNVDPVIYTPQHLPDGVAGTYYSLALSATGGRTPYNWAVSSGTLPIGMAISVDGVLSGNPPPLVDYLIKIKVTDADGRQAQKDFIFDNPDIPPGLEIIEATYGANGSTVNVASTLSSLITNQSLSMNVSNTNLGGDPVPGSVKTLTVKYSMPSGLYLITTQEGSTLNLPSSYAQRLSQSSYEWANSHLSSSQKAIYLNPSAEKNIFWYALDEDCDGLSLIQESAFGGEPFANDAQTKNPRGSYDGANLTYSFMCDAYRNDITYVVQSSSDLMQWVDIAQSVAGAKTLAINGMSQVTDSGLGLREVNVKDTTSKADNTRAFMRLKIVGPNFDVGSVAP